ncbi:MAG: sporulation initiation factor Spo0A C-terminal domain-containing protein [Clostridia bacterium]|nr:sporulation initiation factor Spo0A C-terminal domain-containing protein [Clostridia bacterium]
MFKEYFEKCRIERIEKNIIDILDDLAVPKKLLGYEYLKTAIFLAVEDFDLIDAMTKYLYPFVAKKHQTRPSLVESAMAHAISVTWDQGDIDILNNYFGYTTENRGKPTNSEFIAMIAVHVQLEQENDPLKNRLAKIMNQVVIPANIKGYQYLRTAILMVVENPDIINSVTKELYPSVARQHVTIAARVSSAMRNAIEIAWDRGDVNTLIAYFGDTVQDTTNRKFISTIADQLRR